MCFVARICTYVDMIIDIGLKKLNNCLSKFLAINIINDSVTQVFALYIVASSAYCMYVLVRMTHMTCAQTIFLNGFTFCALETFSVKT